MSSVLSRKPKLSLLSGFENITMSFSTLPYGIRHQRRGEKTSMRCPRLHKIMLTNRGALHGNGPVWSACVRGLMETFGACVLISEHPGSAPNYLQHIKAGKLRAAAERAKPGLGRDIDRLNQIVHPVSGAIYAGFKPIDAEARIARVRFGMQPPDQEEGTEGIVVLANMAALLVEKLTDLLSSPEVLSAGKRIMVSVSAKA
jgi:hypothetical protein